MSTEARKEIVFLVPYFGKLPSYFNTFLLSVANKKFDILFFSDCEQPADLPANCKWHLWSMHKLQQLFSEKLQLKISFTNPQKLCDFKPALGLLFQAHIKDYSFWGSLDLDLCIGDFEKFINAPVLQTIDFFSGIKEYVSGSFFLVRNNEYCNNIFKKSKHWQYVFQANNYLGFDECGGQFFKQLCAGKTFEEIKPPIESFTEIIFREPVQQLKTFFNTIIAEPRGGTTKVDDNSVVYDNKEYLLVHYIYYKTWYSFFTGKAIHFPFFINRLGFFQYKPSVANMLFSKNFRFAVYKKIMINIRKISKQ